MADEIEWELLDRYFGGQCGSEQIERIERWVGREPARAEVVASARAVWEATGVVPKRFDVSAAWLSVRPRMIVPAEQVLHLPRAESAPGFVLPGRRPFRFVAAAAAIAVLAAGALTWKFAADGSRVPTVHARARVYETQRGQRANFYLRDGTHVVLGVASRLEVSPGFGQKGAARDVVLTGEAYFDVRHDSTSRFTVRTGDVITEDIGTAFVVRAYAGDRGPRVAVAEGQVVIHQTGDAGALDGRGTLVSRGQVATVEAGGPVAVRDVADLDPYVGWTRGRIVFKDTPLRDALPQLGRWFDLDFRLGDSALASRHVTATLGDQPSNDVLDLLALSLDARLERRGDVVILYPR